MRSPYFIDCSLTSINAVKLAERWSSSVTSAKKRCLADLPHRKSVGAETTSAVTIRGWDGPCELIGNLISLVAPDLITVPKAEEQEDGHQSSIVYPVKRLQITPTKNRAAQMVQAFGQGSEANMPEAAAANNPRNGSRDPRRGKIGFRSYKHT
jgi:hypothetical protein